MNCINIEQLVQLAARQQVAVPAELGGCIVLAAADQLVAAPLRLVPANLLLFDDGLVRLSGGQEADPLAAEGNLRQLLGMLLESASSVTPALLRAARREPAGDMQSFVRELEIALVPTNRGASKRALARLSREAKRAVELDLERNEQNEDDSKSEPPPVIRTSSEPYAPQVIPSIPDLDVPKSSVHEPESSLSDVAYRGHPGIHSSAEPDVLELLEADVVELVESEQCPPVLLREAPIPPGDCEPGLQPSSVEPTAPFPLTRLIPPAEASGIGEIPPPPPPPPGGQRPRYTRVNKPLFAAMPGPLEQTEVLVETALEQPCSVELGPQTANPTSNDGEGPEAAGVQPRVSRHPATGLEPKGKQSVVGPHRFVARACFAKKASKVTERMSQFGGVDQAHEGDSEQLVSCLQTLATGDDGG